MSTAAPLKVPRAVVYFITWALAIVSIGASINSFQKANADKDDAQRLGPATIPGLNLIVDIYLIIRAGGFLLAGETIIAIISFLSLASLFFTRASKHGAHLITILVWLFAFLWTFGSAIASLYLARNRSAKVSAYLGGVKLDSKLVASLQAQSGLSTAFWAHGYTRFFAIAAWPLLFFTAVSLVLTILARSRYQRSTTAGKV